MEIKREASTSYSTPSISDIKNQIEKYRKGIKQLLLDKDPEKACAFIDIAFLVLIGALIAGASFLPNGGCTAVIFGGWIFCSLLITIILLYRVHIP